MRRRDGQPVPESWLRQAAAILALVLLVACSKEGRTLASDQPQTPPISAADPRAARYEGNAYQVAQGGRYFIWYGCGQCHGSGAQGVLDLGDGRWRHGGSVDRVYAFIAQGHAGALADYGRRIPVEQLWQMTAYIRGLASNDPAKNRRDSLDAKGEPQGALWTGALR